MKKQSLLCEIYKPVVVHIKLGFQNLNWYTGGKKLIHVTNHDKDDHFEVPWSFKAHRQCALPLHQRPSKFIMVFALFYPWKSTAPDSISQLPSTCTSWPFRYIYSLSTDLTRSPPNNLPLPLVSLQRSQSSISRTHTGMMNWADGSPSPSTWY